MRAEYQTKPQAKVCYDFTVCGISVKGSAVVDIFKKAHDQCGKLNKRYGPECANLLGRRCYGSRLRETG